MDLLWPGFLLLLGLIPLLAAVYIWMLRRRRRFVVRYSSLSLVRDALPHQSRWRRHLPFALFLLALTSLVIALTRPVSIISVPAGRTGIILTIDVSRSMCSTDIAPSRLEAAEAAALAFIERQPATTQIGIVAFSSYAEVIQPPTSDTEALQAAVESLATGRRTNATSRAPTPTPVPHGAYAPDIIVLLTDGVSNTGPQPVAAAQQAADRGVRVYTIGFGTATGSGFPPCGPQFQGREPFDSGQFGGGQFGGGGFGGFRRGIDEDTLKQVADMTGGKYYSAESAGELQNVFQSLPTYLITKHETSEISFIFAALGTLLAALAIGLALLWHPLQ